MSQMFGSEHWKDNTKTEVSIHDDENPITILVTSLLRGLRASDRKKCRVPSLTKKVART